MIIYLGRILLFGSSSHTGLHQVEFTTSRPSPAAESISFILRGYPFLNSKLNDTFHLSLRPKPQLVLSLWNWSSFCLAAKRVDVIHYHDIVKNNECSDFPPLIKINGNHPVDLDKGSIAKKNYFVKIFVCLINKKSR